MKPSVMPVRLPRAAIVAAALAALLVAGAAAAADKAKPAPAKKSADAILTPEQLRDCLDKQPRRDKATDAAVKTKADVAAAKAAIDRSGNVLSEEATTLDRTSEDA